ncbi:MAG: FAD-binding oxidoreductase, partial [Chloroflexota bacterium]
MVDGVEPGSAEHPQSEEELARRLADAAGAGLAVIPVGGGRLLGMGDPPERFDVALHTTRLAEITEQSSADMTVSAQAGLTLERLNEELGKAGQFLPLDPFASPGHTVGGLVATALSGPLRMRYGTARDFLIGLRVALPDGRLAASGGRVVKNVSGYDLNKLHLGALGSCGVVVAASFKVFPKPLHEVTVASDGGWEDADRALRLLLPPVALELSSRGRVVARLAGSEAGVKRTAAELGWGEVDPAFWTEHSSRASAAWARIAAPPGRLREVLGTLPVAADWWASPG